MGLKTGRDGSLGLNGLLVEIGARAAPVIETVAADRPQVALLCGLLLRQPAQCLEPTVQNSLLPGGSSTHNQGMGEPCVVIRKLFLKPVPIGMRMPVVQLHQSSRECLARLVHLAVAAQPPQVLVNTQETEGPGAWRAEFAQRW